MNGLSERELDELLSNWRVDPPPDGRLTAGVWRRIAVREAGKRSRRERWELLGRLFGRPPVAVATVAVFVLLGLGAAEVRFQWERGVSAEVGEARYFRAIDPVSLASHRQNP